MMTKKMLGIKNLTDYGDVQGTAAASPSEVFYWNIEVRSLIQRPAGSASGAGYQLAKLDLKIDIFYKCHFLDRNTGLDTTNPGGGTEDEP